MISQKPQLETLRCIFAKNVGKLVQGQLVEELESEAEKSVMRSEYLFLKITRKTINRTEIKVWHNQAVDHRSR